ncbi:MAG: molybdenum cofactor biosynthesis protein MoaE [Legionellales bacterium]|nr:molybdenum cofactor biosynthesis protein MoaE [Legionellales bacterium]
MNDLIITRVYETPLSISEAVHAVQDPKFGALDLFVGSVRSMNLGRSVMSVHYDLFEPLTLQIFQSICQETGTQYHDPLAIYLAHFKGKLPVGGLSVIIAVGAPHRHEAFCACRDILETLKKRAPIWKQEHYTDGCSEWVQGHALCQHQEHTNV